MSMDAEYVEITENVSMRSMPFVFHLLFIGVVVVTIFCFEPNFEDAAGHFLVWLWKCLEIGIAVELGSIVVALVFQHITNIPLLFPISRMQSHLSLIGRFLSTFAFTILGYYPIGVAFFHLH